MNAYQRKRKKELEQLFKDCPNAEVRDVFVNVAKNTTPASMSIPGAMFYKDFNSVSILGDGMSLARFVFSQDFKLVMFANADVWRDNDKLKNISNPQHIPYIFPLSDLRKHVKKIKI